MFEKSAILYLTVETPLHAGSGTGLGVVDLPIQRERSTGYPLVQSSGVKGKLRADLMNTDDEHINTIFGPDPSPGAGPKHAGALSPSDARLLLFPVRSLRGIFAWTTSFDVLARFARDLTIAGFDYKWKPIGPDDEKKAYVAAADIVTLDGKLVLEEFAFEVEQDGEIRSQIGTLAGWLADNVLPERDEYKPWKDWLLKRLVILPHDAFRDFTQFSTEVITRIKMDHKTGTVDRKTGGLWTEENLPTDTILYAPLHASRARAENPPAGVREAGDILKYVSEHLPTRLQLGGNETVGRGLVATRLNLPEGGKDND